MTQTDARPDAVLLISRLLLVVLFIVSGYAKAANFAGAEAYMANTGLPLIPLVTAGVVAIELGLGLVMLLGVLTRPVALVLAAYTLATAFLGHHFWTMEGAARAANLINFEKNLGIMGGFLLLAVTGAGRYSVDAAVLRRG